MNVSLPQKNAFDNVDAEQVKTVSNFILFFQVKKRVFAV